MQTMVEVFILIIDSETNQIVHTDSETDDKPHCATLCGRGSLLNNCSVILALMVSYYTHFSISEEDRSNDRS